MSRTNQTVNVRMSEELVQQVDETLGDRGFSNRSEFIRSAVRDALQKENPYTQQAREEMEEAREAYEQNENDDIDSLLEGAGLDPLPESDEEQEDTAYEPALYDEEQDTWTDETDVTIVGLGGTGARIVTRLHSKDLNQADTVVIDTDEGTLDNALANTRLHVQVNGEDYDETDAETDESERIARIVEESRDKLAEQLFSTTDLVFIISGIGGSTGTTLTPIVSNAAQEAGAVVTTISTLPHTLERERRRQARDDIQQFREGSDTFILIDAARFAEFAPDLTPGQVFENINKYLETALRQMVWHREYLGEIDNDDDHAGLASFFRNGGYATFATGSAGEDDELEAVLEDLYSRSLVETSSETVGSLMHFVQINPDKFTEEEVSLLLDVLFNEPTSLAPRNVNINLVTATDMEDAVQLTSIITGLDIGPDNVIDIQYREILEEAEGRLVVKTDNTSTEQAQPVEGTQSGNPAAKQPEPA